MRGLMITYQIQFLGIAVIFLIQLHPYEKSNTNTTAKY